MTVHNSVEKFLGQSIKTNFIFPNEIENADSQQDKSDVYSNMNKMTILLLEKAITHVRKYDSPETASQLMVKAYRRCPSLHNRKLVVDARTSLNAAIKADKWAKTRRRKKHVDESTVRRNIDAFYEKVSEAVAALRLDLDKRNLSLFSKVKKQYESNLPLQIPSEKSIIKRTAHVVCMCDKSPTDTKYKFTRLESTLFLVENVQVIGINKRKIKLTKEKAIAYGLKKGVSIYETPLSRPSDNIDWYLVLDFGVHVKFASFADNLQIEDDNLNSDLTYEGYLKKQAEERKTREALKTKRLAEIRGMFATDNIALFEDIRRLSNHIDNMVTERAEISAEFTSVTSVANESGLEIGQHRKIYNRSITYRSQLMFEGFDFKYANMMAVKQRLEAKALLIEHQEINMELKKTRAQMTFLVKEVESRKINYAMKLGMVSTTKFLEETVS